MIYVLCLLCGLWVIGWITYRTWYSPPHPSKAPFLLVAVFGGVWYLLGLAAALATSPQSVLFWTWLSPVGIVPTFWLTLLFVLTQIGVADQRWLRPACAAIAAWTLFLLLVHLVPGWRWLFADYRATATVDGAVLLQRTRGTLYTPVLLLNLSAYAATALLVLRHVLRSAGLHRVQSLGMLGGTLMPVCAYVLQATTNATGVDFMLLAFVPSCLVFYRLTVRQRLISSAPIPRHALIDAIREPIIVVSREGLILEANRAAMRLADVGSRPIGTELASHRTLASSLTGPLNRGERSAELELALDGAEGTRFFDAEITAYPASGDPIGRVLVLHDITHRVEVERRLDEALVELRKRLGENEALTARMRELAIRDPLTRLFNRHHCSERHAALMADARQTGHPLAVVLMDIDHFKKINDTHGHPAGDQVLVSFADVLGTGGLPGVECFRYGGEEFLALLPAARQEDVVAQVARWRDALAERTSVLDPVLAPVSFSAGLAMFPRDAQEWGVLIGRADEALYAAKSAGRARTKVWARSGAASLDDGKSGD